MFLCILYNFVCVVVLRGKVKDKRFDNIFSIKDVKIVARKVLHDGFFSLQRLSYKYRLFAGGESEVVEHEVLVRPAAVVVLPFDIKKDSVIFIEQVRSGVVALEDNSPWLYEVVAGLVDEGENIEEAAKRELLEETGLVAQKMIPIMNYWVSPGGTTEKVYAFCAVVDSDNASSLSGLESESEDIRVETFSREDIMYFLDQGKINNSASILCLQWLAMNFGKIERL